MALSVRLDEGSTQAGRSDWWNLRAPTTETGGSQPQRLADCGLVQLERWQHVGYLYIAEISVAV